MAAGRHIRLTAVLVAVVFALTGFSSSGGSSGGKSSGKSKSSSSGGGCSSSKSKKKSHSGSGSTASASATASASPTGDPATVVVVTCTGSATPATTLRFTSKLDRRAAFEVDLHREGAGGAAVESTVVRVDLGARETRTVDVALDDPSRAAQVRNCRLGKPTTSGSSASATPGASSGPTSDGSKGTPAPKASKSRKPR
ncbi:hypothetical protein AB0D66_17375 [Streptomyces sp. NPDC048270]|uniref:hypothetical protein n=1 Tax=Streptomyces sp. NPDC048270 TaxID=3154615 RepID=UPI0033EECEAD